MDLNNINFSEGIREQEIQECFSEIGKQLTQERMNIGGSGIIKGLNLSLYDFSLKITKGSLIDKSGNFMDIEECCIEIEKPQLFKCVEHKVVTFDGEIQLSHTPYNKFRTRASQYEPNKYDRNISVCLAYNKRDVDIVDINDNTIIVDGKRFGSEQVEVEYCYSLPRYDTIYITEDEDTKAPVIRVAQGTSSLSPDVIIPEDYNFIIGVIKIDPYTKFSNSTIKANISIKKLFKQHRNISTNEKNDLIICGENYNDLRLINLDKPTEPKDKSIWYDESNNTLKIWKADSEYWQPLNDKSTTKIVETKIWDSELIKAKVEDKKTFKFDKNELNLRFAPGTNALEIIINNRVLMSDQYDEIIDYTTEKETSGIGFKLGSPIDLDEDTCVEARVTHQVTIPPKQTFQRAATFSYVKDVIVPNNHDCIFNTDHSYITNNNQLEVYHNGKRIKKSDIIEGTDLDVNNRIDKKSNQFKVSIPVKRNDLITYKITANVYSYNTLQTMLGNAKEDFSAMIQNLEDKINKQVKTLNDFMQNTNSSLINLQSKTPKGLIDFQFTKSGNKYETDKISTNSFLSLYDLKNTKMLIKNTDYSLISKNDKTVISFTKVDDNTPIYAMGINL